MRAVYLFCLVWVLQEIPHIASRVELEACPHEMIALPCPLAGTDVTILNNGDQRATVGVLKGLMKAVWQSQMEVVTHRMVRFLRIFLVGSGSCKASPEENR